jgi:antitoxin (DNA-binding transcriptional repressor) of toxin-antitoxin stability system
LTFLKKTKAIRGSMKTSSLREMKANWCLIEEQVRSGEAFEEVNRGKPTVHIVPAAPRKVGKWDDHPSAAIVSGGASAEATVAADRGGRF